MTRQSLAVLLHATSLCYCSVRKEETRLKRMGSPVTQGVHMRLSVLTEPFATRISSYQPGCKAGG